MTGEIAEAVILTKLTSCQPIVIVEQPPGAMDTSSVGSRGDGPGTHATGGVPHTAEHPTTV